MSIFSSIDSQPSVSVIEGYGPDVAGAIVAVTESFKDQLAIYKAINAMDNSELEATSEAAKYTEGSSEYNTVVEQYVPVYEAALSNVFAKIKAFFQKLWTKIKSFFSAVRRRFDLIFKDLESFVKKYESDLKNLRLSGFKAKIYNYTLDESDRASRVADAVDTVIKGNVESVLSGSISKEKIQSAKDALDNTVEDIKSNARKEISGSNKTDMNESEYSEALFSLFRGGARGKEDVPERDVDINKIIADAKGSTALLKVIDNAKTKSDTRYKSLITATDKAAANAKKDRNNTENNYPKVEVDKIGNVAKSDVDEAVSLLQKSTKVIGLIQGIESKFYDAWKTAVEERNKSYKTVIGSALRYKEK